MLFELRHPGKPRRQIPVLQLLAHWQSRQDHIKITDRCRSSSSLLYSPHCWYFLGTKEIIKFFFPPLSFHPFKSLGTDQNLLRSDIIRPREPASGIPIQVAGGFPPYTHSEAVPFLSPSQPHWDAHTSSGDGQLSSPASATKGRTWGSFCIYNSLHAPGKPHPDASRYPYYHPSGTIFSGAPRALSLFPSSFIINTKLVFTNFF